jgi:predicted DNA-binding transcriptional regulator AlpA
MEWHRIQDLQARWKVSRAHLYAMMDRGDLPRGVRFGRCVRWRDLDIVAAEARLVAAARAEVAP